MIQMKNSYILSAISLMSIPAITTYAAEKKVLDPKHPEKKNVILILTDDMRFDMLNYAGGKAKTSNLDELRNSGTDFSNACTVTGLSSPSRAALFTGRLAHRTGLNDNLHLWHCKDMTLPIEQSTIYEWAKDKNYNVGYFGKWHVGYVTPDVRGVDQYVGSANECLRVKPKRPSFEAIERYYDKKVFKDKADSPEKPDYYCTLKTTYEKSEPKKQVDLGIKFLNEAVNDERPFFLTVSFHYPHPPYRVPSPWNKMYDYRDVQLPPSYRKDMKKGLEYQYSVMWPWMDLGHMTENDWKKTIAYSMGMVTMLDQALGELFQTIKDKGLWDNTMIVFASDQGSMLAEHGLYDKGPYAYDGLMRIPLLMKVPGAKPEVVKHQVSLIDINQTLVEYMGLQPRQSNQDSRSLLPLVYDGDEAWKNVPDESFFFYEYYNGHWFGERAIRTPEYKYCFNPCGDDELYDLKNDPHEMVNLINKPELKNVIKDLRVRLYKHLVKTEDDHAIKLFRDYTGIGREDE